MSFARPRPGGNSVYLGHIKEVGHGSVLEHAVWNLLFTGVSRSLGCMCPDCYHAAVRRIAGQKFNRHARAAAVHFDGIDVVWLDEGIDPDVSRHRNGYAVNVVEHRALPSSRRPVGDGLKTIA